jgi:hypothetical protein
MSAYVSRLLCDRIITRGLWPPRTPDLSFCDLYLWGYLKGKVYKNKPRSIEALQNEITRIIGSITMDELQKVSQNLFMRCEACVKFYVLILCHPAAMLSIHVLRVQRVVHFPPSHPQLDAFEEVFICFCLPFKSLRGWCLRTMKCKCCINRVIRRWQDWSMNLSV